MSRIIAVGLFSLICLATTPVGFGQARDRRLDDALGDITFLKRVVKEQDRRISDLEKAVKAFQTATTLNLEKSADDEHIKILSKPSAAIPWQVPLAWSRIKAGMSRVQVEEILGPPTSVNAVIDSQTLMYKGDLPGTGPLTATVKLTDDRVAQVAPPDF